MNVSVSGFRPFADAGFVPGDAWERGWFWLLQNIGASWLVFAFYLFMTACYVSSGGVFWFLEKKRVLERYRLQPGKWPRDEDYVKTLWNIFQNYIVVILPMTGVAPPVLEYLGISAFTPLPGWRRVVVDLVFCMLVEDLFQYLFHRFLHLPWLYPRVHKVHHEWTTPFAMAASYSHPVETIFLALATFAVKTHSGWAWPGVDHVLHVIPSYEGAVFHDFHHRTFLFNYASRFAFIDLLFGTYKHPTYDPLEQKSQILSTPAPSAKLASQVIYDAPADSLTPFKYNKRK